MRRLCQRYAALLLILPFSAMAEEAMIPGKPYEVRTPVTDPARVIFHPDSRVLVWEGDAATPEDTGRWFREGAEFCIEESDEFAPLCLDEVAGEGGAFSLIRDGRSMDFVPED